MFEVIRWLLSLRLNLASADRYPIQPPSFEMMINSLDSRFEDDELKERSFSLKSDRLRTNPIESFPSGAPPTPFRVFHYSANLLPRA